ncbi:MAG: hypothetical protein ABI632_03065 [Pseudolysinimonas sp.]
MSETPDASTPSPAPQPMPSVAVLPAENLLRGTIFALGILPAGVIVWGIVAKIGFISGVVGIGIALGALALYRIGSGGRISYNGAIRVSLIVIVTLIVSFLGSFVVVNPSGFSRAAAAGKFFDEIAYVMSLGGSDVVINVLLVIAFAALGVFTVFRTARVQATQDRAAGHS